MEQKTPLYDRHAALGGKIVPFAGWLLPVQYPAGVIAEHTAVRQNVGLFDVSHMGEVTLSGADALKNLNHILTNDFTNLEIGRVRYSVMCYDDGGCVDDLIVYRIAETAYLIVVNASNREKDVAWIRAHLSGDVTFTDISDDVALLALQGPFAKQTLAKLTDGDSLPTRYYSFRRDLLLAGYPCMISQTGYTGEFGYEIFLSNAEAPLVFDKLLEAGEEFGILPCGLGARDTLRLEAAMPLYGHEMDETIDPLEAGLSFAVKLDKPDFIGKAAILAKGAPARTRVGLRMTGRGIAREHQDVYRGGSLIGHTTSGTFCPHLGYAAAMALLDASQAETAALVEVDVRGRRIEAEIVPLPFYKRAK